MKKEKAEFCRYTILKRYKT